MIAFIKNYELDALKRKMILLYVLNVTDIIFTVTLLQTGFFAEANILMANAVQHPALGFLLKIILPAIILFYLYKRVADTDDEVGLRSTNIGILISLTLYTVVNITHLVWIAMLPYLYRLSSI